MGRVYRFWDPVLRPIAEAARARCLVEVGVEAGLLSEKVLDYCSAADGVLHAIDPRPQLNVAEWQHRYGQRLEFHLARSLDVLGDIHRPDVILIDGDHNWYTVYHELKLIEETALADEALPPVIALHDVDWPYGRRDMYYNPDTIPVEHRHPHKQLGVVPGKAELVTGGVNFHLHHAVDENTRHNGVRTAIEDFIGESHFKWCVAFVPGFHGLCVSAPEDRLAANESLDHAVKSIASAGFLERWARELDMARITGTEIPALERLAAQNQTLAQQKESIADLEQRVGESDHLRALLVEAEQRLAGVPQLMLRISDLERELGEARAVADSTREQMRDLDGRLMESHKVLADVLNSPSWRVTKPLRTAKHLLRGTQRRAAGPGSEVLVDVSRGPVE
jgi:Methyltransferase domain